MKKSSRWVGLDVHGETIAVAVAEKDGAVRSVGTIPNRPEAVRRMIRKLGEECKLHVCYEAGPCGYVLYWQLAEMGIDCQVVAPTLIPMKVGDRVKTDRRDAEKLARCHRSGDLTAVWVPGGRAGGLARSGSSTPCGQAGPASTSKPARKVPSPTRDPKARGHAGMVFSAHALARGTPVQTCRASRRASKDRDSSWLTWGSRHANIRAATRRVAVRSPKQATQECDTSWVTRHGCTDSNPRCKATSANAARGRPRRSRRSPGKPNIGCTPGIERWPAPENITAESSPRSVAN